jgi:hypothetical protein
MLFVLLYALVVLLITALVAALLLAIGTALTYLFAVSVWEATVVAMVVAAGAIWVLNAGGPHDLTDEDLSELAEGAMPPRFHIADLASRRRRDRKRPRH